MNFRFLPLLTVFLRVSFVWSGPTQVKNARGSEDLDRRVDGLDSLLNVLAPRTVMEENRGDHHHHVPVKSQNQVERGDMTVSGLRRVVQGMGSANRVMETDKDTQAVTWYLEDVEETLRELGGVGERHRRSSSGEIDLNLADRIGFLEDIVNELFTDELEEAEGGNEELLEEPANLSHENYDFLLRDFNLTKEDIVGVSALPEEEFVKLLNTLKQQDTEGARMTELLTLLRSLPRQLVTQEMEAAAQGVLEVTRHLGDRLRLQILPQASLGLSAGVQQVVDTLPEDVKGWVGEGGKVAARRAKQVAEYAGPRLAELGKSMDRLQHQLREETEDNVMPALEELMKEVRQTIATAQEVVPPMMELVGQEISGLVETMQETSRPVYLRVSDGVRPAASSLYDVVVDPVSESVERSGKELYLGSLGPMVEGLSELYEENVGPAVGELGDYYQDTVEPAMGQFAERTGELVREQVMPVVEQAGEEARQQIVILGDKVKTDVAPTVKNVMKSTLDGVFRGVPSLIQQLSHETHDAAKLFKGKYSAALDKMRTNDQAPVLPSTLAPPGIKRPSKKPKRQYPTSTEL